MFKMRPNQIKIPGCQVARLLRETGQPYGADTVPEGEATLSGQIFLAVFCSPCIYLYATVRVCCDVAGCLLLIITSFVSLSPVITPDARSRLLCF